MSRVCVAMSGGVDSSAAAGVLLRQGHCVEGAMMQLQPHASAADAAAVLAATGGGVPLIASAHAGSIGELFSRAALRPLLSSGCFGAYIGISREGGAYRYTVTDAEQVVEGEGVRCGSG